MRLKEVTQEAAGRRCVLCSNLLSQHNKTDRCFHHTQSEYQITRKAFIIPEPVVVEVPTINEVP